MESAKQRLGRRLREIRKAKGLSLELLGLRSELTPSYCGAIERGSRSATIDTVEKLANGLQVSMGDLLAADEIHRVKEVEELLQDIPSRQRAQALLVLREAILLLRGAAQELQGPRRGNAV